MSRPPVKMRFEITRIESRTLLWSLDVVAMEFSFQTKRLPFPVPVRAWAPLKATDAIFRSSAPAQTALLAVSPLLNVQNFMC